MEETTTNKIEKGVWERDYLITSWLAIAYNSVSSLHILYTSVPQSTLPIANLSKPIVMCHLACLEWVYDGKDYKQILSSQHFD